MDDIQSFRRKLTRLTPGSAANTHVVDFLNAYKGDYEQLFKAFVDEMNRSSLNGRAKQINMLEYSAGIVGRSPGPPKWNKIVATNLHRVVDVAVPPQLAPPALVNIENTRRLVQGFLTVKLISSEDATNLATQIDGKERSLNMLSATRQGKRHASREEILRRMEDDRERNKKYKERQLAANLGSDEEFENLWAGTPALDNKDRALYREACSLI